mmetsp:Transcript_2901/g.6841  ORF Transcript_2901/g.6841 Transcript_2901/m.6841 type:complete len:580 (-) Transcript_2901:251-1990(-)
MKNSQQQYSRKRQRSSHLLHPMLFLTLAIVSSTTEAFLPPSYLLKTHAARTAAKTTFSSSDLNSTRQVTGGGEQQQVDEEGRSSNWDSWMKRGRKTSSLIYREPEELGGIVRPDRYSSRDWLHNTLSLPNSAILRAIKIPVLFMTCWATFLSVLHRRLLTTNPVAAQMMCIPTTPHQLMVSALSLLLVFKTNSAYQRFAEGRKIWETIINQSRDLYRMLILYEKQIGKGKRRRLQRLLAAFPYFLRHRIRPNLVMYRLDDVENVRDPKNTIVLYQDKAVSDLDPESAAVAAQEESQGNSRRRTRPLYWVDRRTLPWRLLPESALGSCARAQNRPLWVCDRMAQELRNVPDQDEFSARERLTLMARVEKLSGCVGACERIHQTAVPLNYARHSLRALTLWLFTLPFALVSSLQIITGPVIFLISWLLFGVYEIGYSIEDPFQGTLRLSVLCDCIRRDVLADEMIRNTAFEPEVAEEAAPTTKDELDYESSPISENEEKKENKANNNGDDNNSSNTPVTPPAASAENLQQQPPPPVEDSIGGPKDEETPQPTTSHEKIIVEELPELPSKQNSQFSDSRYLP